MIDVFSRVFTNVRIHVGRLFPSVNTQNSRTATPPSLPAVSVLSIDAPEVALDLDLGTTEDDVAIRSNIEIQVYSNRSITESRQIITAACNAMRGMTYRRTFGPAEVVDNSNPNLYRMIARFSRIVSDLDDLPRFPES